MKSELLRRIESELNRLPDHHVDLSDIGNSLALAISTFISSKKHGFTAKDFRYGIDHVLYLSIDSED